MLTEVFHKLDDWIVAENRSSIDDGTPIFEAVHVQVIGQSALLEANLSLNLVSTMDVDLEQFV